MAEVIKGTAQQCFTHFAQEADSRQFADFVNFMRNPPRQTVQGWVKPPFKLPVGEYLIRLCFYLDSNGYKVEELEHLRTPVRDCGRLLAFDIVGLEDIMRVLKIDNDSSGRSQVLSILRGAAGLSFERLEALKAFAAGFQEQLRGNMEKFSKPAAASMEQPRSAKAESADFEEAPAQAGAPMETAGSVDSELELLQLNKEIADLELHIATSRRELEQLKARRTTLTTSQ